MPWPISPAPITAMRWMPVSLIRVPAPPWGSSHAERVGASFLRGARGVREQDLCARPHRGLFGLNSVSAIYSLPRATLCSSPARSPDRNAPPRPDVVSKGCRRRVPFPARNRLVPQSLPVQIAAAWAAARSEDRDHERERCCLHPDSRRSGALPAGLDPVGRTRLRQPRQPADPLPARPSAHARPGRSRPLVGDDRPARSWAGSGR